MMCLLEVPVLVHVFACINVRVRICIYALDMNKYTRMHTYVCIYIHMHTYICPHIYMYRCVCRYAHMYTHTFSDIAVYSHFHACIYTCGGMCWILTCINLFLLHGLGIVGPEFQFGVSVRSRDNPHTHSSHVPLEFWQCDVVVPCQVSVINCTTSTWPTPS